MQGAADPLTAIASSPPQFTAGEIASLVAEQYALHGELDALVSERDQNFRLTTADQHRYVIKIANAAEAMATTDFQIRALQHIQRTGCPVAVPQVVLTLGGATMTTASSADAEHALRVVSYVPGRPLEDIEPDVILARQLGRCLAEIGIALRGFEHPGDSQPLLWDMRRAAELRRLLRHITDAELRAEIGNCLDDFADNVAPRLDMLRSQVIHNDMNPGNVLVTTKMPVSIAGVIDFGDMIRAPLVIDVAVAASYLRSDDDDALAMLMSFVGGYAEVRQFDGAELEVLYDLVRTRLATTLTILYWRVSARGEADAYTTESLQGGASAARFLKRINRLSRSEFRTRLHDCCNLDTG